MKIVKISGPTTKVARDIPQGTVFSGKIGPYKNRIFFKSFRSIHALDAADEIPHNMWNDDTPVEDYIELEAELHVKGVKQ